MCDALAWSPLDLAASFSLAPALPAGGADPLSPVRRQGAAVRAGPLRERLLVARLCAQVEVGDGDVPVAVGHRQVAQLGGSRFPLDASRPAMAAAAAAASSTLMPGAGSCCLADADKGFGSGPTATHA
eukprot:CAMPEP_0196695454 /NCGR_PEP_ID=MMETSP1090-20130531/36758_1 /TAXON_ID=37098 /ORGANISM="Isochrysis sp, Strain CCMP1244" /LENGTH=127 /DNA_ID=CAMNT_0042034997 /DNA_START=9 /DNA_END=389 /DNA_ORIENTATION=-